MIHVHLPHYCTFLTKFPQHKTYRSVDTGPAVTDMRLVTFLHGHCFGCNRSCAHGRAIAVHSKFCYSSGSDIPESAWSKTQVCGRSLAGIADSNPAGGMDVFLL